MHTPCAPAARHEPARPLRPGRAAVPRQLPPSGQSGPTKPLPAARAAGDRWPTVPSARRRRLGLKRRRSWPLGEQTMPAIGPSAAAVSPCHIPAQPEPLTAPAEPLCERFVERMVCWAVGGPTDRAGPLPAPSTTRTHDGTGGVAATTVTRCDRRLQSRPSTKAICTAAGTAGTAAAGRRQAPPAHAPCQTPARHGST